jgi:FkbM family methyltransferase
MLLGGGIGIVAALGARVTKTTIVVVEANEALHPVIARQIALNGGSVELVHAAVVADAGACANGTVAFTIADEFWFSRVGESATSRPVPARSIDELCAAHKPNIVVMDIEGGEAELLIRPLPSCIRTLLVEIHTPDLGSARTGELVSALLRDGFQLADQQQLTWAFKR